MRKNVASQYVAFQMNSTTDGSAVTTGTPTVYYTIDAGTQGTGSGTATHEGNGQWSYAPAQAETNGNHVAFTMALSGAISQTVNVWPVSFDPTSSDLGAPAVTLAATATSAQLVDDIWDEVLTGATHNIHESSGKRIRDLQEYGTYAGGAIFIDTNNGTAGTTDYESGTYMFPVDTIADANTLAASLGLIRFRIAPSSSITLAATQSGETFTGKNWTLALGGQDISDTEIVGATISGTATATGSPTFDDCVIGTVNLPTSTIKNSILNSTLTLGEAGNYNFINSHGEGLTGCTVDFGAAIGNSSLTFCNWSGVLELQNMGQAGTDAAGIGGCGIITINANCTGGTLYLIGNFNVTDNSGGAVTIINADDRNHVAAKASINDASPTTTSFSSTLPSTTDNFYNNQSLLFISGALKGQCRVISDYTGATATPIFDEAFTSAPANGDSFIVLANHVHPVSEITADIDANSTQLAAIIADTNELQTDWANGGRLDLLIDAIKVVTDALPDGGALTNLYAQAVNNGVDINTVITNIAALNDISVSDVLTTQMTESYSADGVAPTLAQALFLIQQVLTEFAIAGTTTTIKKLDGSTTAATLLHDDATSATSATRSS